MVAKKSYRDLQSELDAVLMQMQSAELDIDKALDLYKEGKKLIEELENHLKTAKNEIESLAKTSSS